MSQLSPRRDRRPSLEEQLEADAKEVIPRGKSRLFTLPAGVTPDSPSTITVVESSPEDELPPAESAVALPVPELAPTPRPVAPVERREVGEDKPARSTSKLEERSNRGAGLAKGTYVVTERHDRMLRELSLIPEPPVPLEEVARQALDSYFVVTGLDGDLLAMTACPVPNPKESEPGMIHITVRIWPRQAMVLKKAKVLFNVEASEIVRQAIERYYRHMTGKFAT